MDQCTKTIIQTWILIASETYEFRELPIIYFQKFDIFACPHRRLWLISTIQGFDDLLTLLEMQRHDKKESMLMKYCTPSHVLNINLDYSYNN